MKKIILTLLSVSLLVIAAARADNDAARIKEAEKILRDNDVKTDGEGLLKFFQRRTLTPPEKLQVETWITQLNSNSFRVREMATAKLIDRGPVALELLQKALKNPPDLEVALRAEKCIEQIRDKDLPREVPVAAAQMLRRHKPDGAVKVLLDYLPFADSEMVADEVRRTLTVVGITDGKPHELLVKALEAKEPAIRASAAEALSKVSDAQIKDTLRGMMKDPAPLVRLRVALALAMAGDRQAVGVLIDTLPDLDRVYALRAEDILLQIAEDNNPPKVRVGSSKESREKCRTAWNAWWESKGTKIEWSKKDIQQRIQGFTVVLLLDEGKVMELGAGDEVRWQAENIEFPLDVQVLPNGNLLVAEYNQSRIAERNLKGDVVWQFRVADPLVAERLPDGRTFIGTNTQMLVVNKDGSRDGPAFSFFDGMRIRKSSPLPDGNFLCLRDDSRVVILDPKTRREIHNFAVQLNRPLFGGKINATPDGNILVPHHAENKVTEYSPSGKVIWEVKIEEPVAALRLDNGNTLVTSMSQNRAVEFDPEGRELWEYKSNTRVTRVLRR